MKRGLHGLFSSYCENYFAPSLDFRVRLFNMMASAGICVSFIFGALSFINGEPPASILGSLCTAPVAFGLMRHASRTGRYQLCYTLTIVIIFLVAFPFIFFVGGGYRGAMPSFFVFAAVFTVFMLEGKRALFFVAVELLTYVGICLYAYFHHSDFFVFESEKNSLRDIITGFTVASISLGISLHLHFREYELRRRQLLKAREDATAANKAKSDFLANMSHEIRTPINVMLGMNEMIRRETTSEVIADYSAGIEDSGKTLMNLVDDILDVAKTESGRYEISEATYRTADLALELSRIGREFTNRKGVEFSVDADPNMPSELRGDFEHIRQIAANFLSNAAKYTERGSVALKILAAPQGEGEIALAISVTDTGIGIKDEDIPLIFDKFTRLDMKLHRNIQGSGLGLSIAKELAALMGGSISVASIFGKGSSFTVSLPQTVQDTTPIGEWERQPRRGAGEDNPRIGDLLAPACRVLAVDDNPGNLKMIESMLGGTMMKVDTAASGEECVNSVKKANERGEPYHVILMDYMMPVMDGIETFRRLKDKVPDFAVPTIAVTADTVSGTYEMFIDAGFALYLPKPVAWDELKKALASCLPEGSYSLTKGGKTPIFTENMFPELTKIEAEMSARGVSLAIGLRYAGGDLSHYRELAGIFTDDCESSRGNVETALDADDLEALAHCVHSLKSKAGNVGAENLRDTASRLERLCHSGDSEYVGALLPALRLEWTRARNGLNLLIMKFDEIFPARNNNEQAPPDLLEKLLAHVERHEQGKALIICEKLLAASEKDSSEGIAYAEIRAALEKIDFEDAEARILKWRSIDEQSACN